MRPGVGVSTTTRPSNPPARLRASRRDRPTVGMARAPVLERFVETFAKAPPERRGVAQDRKRPRMSQAAEGGQGVSLLQRRENRPRSDGRPRFGTQAALRLNGV